MENRKANIAIISVSILVGLVLSVHIKTINNESYQGVLPTYRSQQLANEVTKLQSEKVKQLNRIEELENKIKQYEEIEVNKNDQLEDIYEEVLRYRMISGHIDLKGKGIILKINEPDKELEFEDIDLIDTSDLILQLISILNAADAEAISINGQRYTSFTEVVKAGNHIEINGVSTSYPLEIRAIGDSETLESALSLKGGVLWQLKKYNYTVKLKKETEIEIPKNKKTLDFKYSRPRE